MKEIERKIYLDRLINARGIKLIKVITGIRRCDKSYLLNHIFRDYLLDDGVKDDHIIHIDLERRENSKFLDADTLYDYIKNEARKDNEKYYVLLDEVQLVNEFESVLNSLLHIDNVDVYVTGSNSKFLSKDIITEFRGRSEEIRLFPLSFSEFMSAYGGSKEDGWREYIQFGGLPLVLDQKTPEEKMEYLKQQQENIYLRDIVNRYKMDDDTALKSLVEVISSSVGSLTNPYKLEKTFKSMAGVDLSYNTIDLYLDRLEDVFIIEKSKRFDVKGKKYLNTPQKYYFTDMGIRNSFINFRQIEENHIMENVIYNELRSRGCSVDVGLVETRDGDSRKQLEIDFVVNKGMKKYYVQSAFRMDNEEKQAQELRPLDNVDDFFKRIIITGDSSISTVRQDGIVVMNLFDFLLDKNSLEW